MAARSSFIDNLADNHRRITLIGMSGLGKSYWSRMLSQKGFRRFCCDDIISDRLLNPWHEPKSKVGCLGQWMGFPFQREYRTREKRYLAAETDVLLDIIAYVETTGPHEKIAIDTTGSAPYTGDALMKRLKELTCMVHLAVSEDAVPEMLDRYMRSPRPVLWGGLYSKQPSETDQEALARSYKALLAYREALYRKYAHCSVPYELHRIPS